MRLAAIPILVSVALSSFAACGSDADACVDMGKAICAKACACNGGAQCRFVQPDGLATATKTEDACNQYWESACEGVTFQRIDSTKCTAEVGEAECIPNENVLDGKAMAAKLPVSCGEIKDP